MADWLPATEPWPSHQWSFWNDVLQIARDHGWYLKIGKNHVFAKIACKPAPSSLGPGDVCAEVIFKTGGKNPEKVAKQTAALIKACQHENNGLDEGDDVDVDPSSLVREASVLLDGAAKLIDSGAQTANAAELLELAQSRVEDADELLDGAAAAEREALRSKHAGDAILAGIADEGLTAGEAIDDAEAKLQDAEKVADESAIRADIRRTKDRAAHLRDRLASLEDSGA